MYYFCDKFSGRKRGISIPLIYALACDKTENTYVTIFKKIKELIPEIAPIQMMTDFEKAGLNAVTKEFPAAIIKGCFYHFCQSIWRHIQQIGLQERYVNDLGFAAHIRMIPALAFAPEGDVVELFEKLEASPFFEDDNEKEQNDEVQALLGYFEATYIGQQSRNRRKRPLYNIAIWNMYDNTVNALPRTNNSVEGWHNALKNFVGCNHPSLFKFIEAIKKEQAIQENKMVQLNGGVLLEERRKSYRDHDKAIKRVVESYAEYEDDEKLDYLQSIANNLSF